MHRKYGSSFRHYASDVYIKRFAKENSPCTQDCPERKAGCGIDCKKYAAYKERLIEFKKGDFIKSVRNEEITNAYIDTSKKILKRDRLAHDIPQPKKGRNDEK